MSEKILQFNDIILNKKIFHKSKQLSPSTKTFVYFSSLPPISKVRSY